MKPSPELDFYVSVRCQTWEEDPKVAFLYQGIFDVTLNHTISLMFVPKFDIELDYLPLMLPDNVDDISMKSQARQITVALAKYTITPKTNLTKLDDVYQISQEQVIFWVSDEAFQTFSEELLILAQEQPGVNSLRKISAIQQLSVSKFILEKVIQSKYFAKEDLQILGREPVCVGQFRLL